MGFNTSYIDLSNVKAISRGDSTRMMKYIRQFHELISERRILLKEALSSMDRVQIRQITHKMIPQLKFFGVKEVSDPINRLEFEYNSMPKEELQVLVLHIISRLEGAIDDVSKILDENFE
jgi:hypothetical protein